MADAQGAASSRPVAVQVGAARLEADLVVPPAATATVVFAHGSGSSRHSPRNRAVASGLNDVGLATLLMDLLTPQEERVDEVTRELRFDIALLADRLTAAVDWLTAADGDAGEVAALPVGTFGASTGAAAALIAAARRPGLVRAVVSRGGRPDLAGDALAQVRAPVLLIVGGNDLAVLDLNRAAARRLAGEHEIAVVPGATHLFGEPGALEQVIALAAGWFSSRLTAA